MVYMDLGTIIDSVARLAFGILVRNIYRQATTCVIYSTSIQSIEKPTDGNIYSLNFNILDSIIHNERPNSTNQPKQTMQAKSNQ